MSVDRYFIDTNIFLRLIVKDQQAQYQHCVDFFHNAMFNSLTLYTSHIVLAEINWTLTGFYRYDKTRVINGLRSIVSAPFLKFTESFDVEMAFDYYSQFSVKYIDAVIASHADIVSGKMAVVSYDKDFDKMGIKRLEPKTLV